MRIYYDHLQAEQKFGSKFYFDTGAVIDKKLYTHYSKINSSQEYFKMFDYKTNNNYILRFNDYFYPKNKKLVRIQHGSQGYETFVQKYKIIWSVRNSDLFQFAITDCMFSINQSRIISSDNKLEILYLFAMLNSNISKKLISAFLKNENEKDFFVAIKSIKEYIRVPKITGDNQKIKKEIIKKTEEMLGFEKFKLSDFVDFSKVMVQKFDNVLVENNNLILEKNKEKIKIPIKASKNLVKKMLTEKYDSKTLKFDKQQIILSELKSLPVIDYAKQQKIKNYIDDLVFALYLNIGLDNLGINKASQIKAKLSKNKFYKLVNN